MREKKRPRKNDGNQSHWSMMANLTPDDRDDKSTTRHMQYIGHRLFPSAVMDQSLAHSST